MRNAGLKEAQAGIKIAGRNINNLRYADGTTLMAESEEELKSHLMKVKSESEVTQSCPTLSNPMDCSPLGSSIHGIFQARVLEWGAIAFSERNLYRWRNLHLHPCPDTLKRILNSSAVQKKYNSSHMCNFKFSCSCIKKREKQVMLI